MTLTRTELDELCPVRTYIEFETGGSGGTLHTPARNEIRAGPYRVWALDSGEVRNEGAFTDFATAEVCARYCISDWGGYSAAWVTSVADATHVYECVEDWL